jgi:hypothetical protein
MDLKKLKITIAAALMAGQLTTPVEASVNRDQLLEIREYITAVDVQGLVAYLEANPRLMQGTSEVSGQLARYYDMETNGLMKFAYLARITSLKNRLSKVRSDNGIY